MSDESSLERAHSLSAHASILLAPGHVTSQTLSLALKAYTDAANLFEQAWIEAEDVSAKRTLQLLMNQHRKLAKDLERKLDRGEGPSRETEVRGTVRRSQTTPVPTRDGPSLGLGAIGREAWPPPGVATRVSPARGLPPFAMRPTSIPTQEAVQLSPLHSSSSSSGTETGTGGSYYNFGAIPDTLDPFSRFWGKLDNMLDDISNPVAFATASMDGPAGTADGEERQDGDKRERRRTSDRKKEKEKGKEKGRAESPGSFYLVSKNTIPKDSSSSRTSSPTEKTPEELILENENLRISLDAIASHAQRVDDENKRLRTEVEERSKMMKSAILEVKREAVKVKQGQDLMRSQLLGSIPSPNPRRLEASRYPSGNSDLVNSQGKRIEGLEEELRLLRIENEKNKDAAVKYKEKIDKIKANAKSKKEAKLRGEESRV